MVSPLDALELKPSMKSRQPLCRTRTLDTARAHTFGGRRDNNSSFSGGFDFPGVPDQHGPAKPKSNKHVRFADEKENTCHVLDPIFEDADDLKEFYVLPDELREIKRLGFMACKEAQRTGLAGLLTEIYGTSNERDIQDRLNYWCRMGSACRGLERFANEELSKRRNIFRKRAIVSVLEAQQQLKNEKGIDTANVLRRLSEAYTEQARLFALRLAAADFHAIQTVKAPPPPPRSPKAGSPKSTQEEKADDINGSAQRRGSAQRVSRKSRAERMKERAAAEKGTATPAAAAAQLQGENGVLFRRNNTTMTAVVLQQKSSTNSDVVP
ncbi:expressed unknown protein [Seminavis robusta]|uniref:Uncharacterized protein n=1 Tax=Seminavis robusta TaxID=568900 RepID=A0A9N8E0C1_9STRA|nr:expressed unknown protein [Seminavis robusta]|eukprot:Sro424_g139940.1 n/a (325) ;mRNA; f:28171-29145